jgi:hypothetical protein
LSLKYPASITAEMIANGEPGGCFTCPVALSMKAALPPELGDVSVVGEHARVGDCYFKLPNQVAAFTIAFDDRKPVDPLDWEIELPEIPAGHRLVSPVPANAITIPKDVGDAFAAMFEEVATIVNRNARDKGFWDDNRPDGVGIALIHAEISEALESIRGGHPPDHHCPEFTNTEIELADAVIRIMDLAAQRRWRVAEAIVAKANFNANRPRMHGKKF